MFTPYVFLFEKKSIIGKTVIEKCDNNSHFLRMKVSGESMSGFLDLTNNYTTSNELTTKKYTKSEFRNI